MVRLLSILILIFSILLFPPAVLAVVSNNAVPGDVTYPIKRFLEDRIFDVASITPQSKAWFASARSDRRFTEIKVLVTSGKSAKVTLKELVSQADAAVEEIDKVKDPVKKKELLEKYEQTIEEYQKGLTELKEEASSSQPDEEIIEPTPTQEPARTPRPTKTPRPTSVSPTPRITSPPGDFTTPAPTSTPRVTEAPTQRPTVYPTQSPNTEQPRITPPADDDIDDAIDDLDDIKDKIKDKKDKSKEQKESNENTKSLAGSGENPGISRLSQVQPYGYLNTNTNENNFVPASATPTPSPDCKMDCKNCPSTTTCGHTTYDTCEDNAGGKTKDNNLCKTGGTKFKCFAKDNDKCSSFDAATSNEFVYSCSSCNVTPIDPGSSEE